MNTPLVTIITATYNRPQMFAECAAEVLAQMFTAWQWWIVMNRSDWPIEYEKALFWSGVGRIYQAGTPRPRHALWEDPRVHLIWFPTDEKTRESAHIPARIVNLLYAKVTAPYIYWLSDDDLIDRDGLAWLVDHAEVHQLSAVYGRCEVIDQQSDGSYKHGSWCYDAGDVGLGTGISPHCRLDGGQVLHTADLWRRAVADGWQLTDSKADGPSNDGTLLARLAEFARFHYVPQRIVTHRRHAGATYHKPQVCP